MYLRANIFQTNELAGKCLQEKCLPGNVFRKNVPANVLWEEVFRVNASRKNIL
jgi:hypothetical protein